MVYAGIFDSLQTPRPIFHSSRLISRKGGTLSKTLAEEIDGRILYPPPVYFFLKNKRIGTP